ATRSQSRVVRVSLRCPLGTRTAELTEQKDLHLQAFSEADEGTRTLDLLHGTKCLRTRRRREMPASSWIGTGRIRAPFREMSGNHEGLVHQWSTAWCAVGSARHWRSSNRRLRVGSCYAAMRPASVC